MLTQKHIDDVLAEEEEHLEELARDCESVGNFSDLDYFQGKLEMVEWVRPLLLQGEGA